MTAGLEPQDVLIVDVGSSGQTDPFQGFSDSLTSLCIPADENTDCQTKLTLSLQAVVCNNCADPETCNVVDCEPDCDLDCFNPSGDWLESTGGISRSWNGSNWEYVVSTGTASAIESNKIT